MLHQYDQKVFGWYANWDGCAYYRIIKPMEALSTTLLSQETWGTKYGRSLPNGWQDYDVIIGQRVCMSDGDGGGPADLWANEITNDRHVLSVYEVDDDLLNVDPSNPAAEFFNDPATKQNIKLCAQKADLVTVSTEPLREQMLKWNPNVRVVPNFIDHDVLDIWRKQPDPDKVVIGWCGSPTHEMDFAPMGEELGITMGMLPQTRFMTIGGNFTHGLPIDRVRALGWISKPRKVYDQIAKFDIGIAPLVPHVFNESKSYIKALEYAALGIPTVASNVGPYKDFVEHGVTGFLVDKPGDWMEYITLLVKDTDLRERMGENARNKANRYTIQGNIWRWADALRG